MKIVLIIPYFGKFPEYFNVFLNSCKYNKDYTWLIYTDNQEKYVYPQNVIKKFISYEQVKEKIAHKFDFSFEIKYYHKLCDLKPAYGYIFEEDIKDFDFWGFCDMDLIWGDLNKFITPKILEKYDKIYTFGHLTLFKNTYENNRRFMKNYEGAELYKEAFLKNTEWVFDEGYRKSINNIYEENGYPMYKGHSCADIYTKSSDFRLVIWKNDTEKVVQENKKGLFWWKEGKLYFLYKSNGKLIREEYSYLHLQKRKMKVKGNVANLKSLKIVPNVIEEQIEDITEENFKKIKKKYFNLHYFKLRTKNLIYKIKLRAGLLD